MKKKSYTNLDDTTVVNNRYGTNEVEEQKKQASKVTTNTLINYNDDMAKKAVGNLVSDLRKVKNDNTELNPSYTQPEHKEMFSTTNIRVENELKERANRSQEILREIEEREIKNNEIELKNSRSASSQTRVKPPQLHNGADSHKVDKMENKRNTSTKRKMSEKQKRIATFRITGLCLIIFFFITTIVLFFSNTKLKKTAVLYKELEKTSSNLKIENQRLNSEVSALQEQVDSLLVANIANTNTEESIENQEESTIDNGGEEEVNIETPSEYVVQAGDSLWKISQKIYGNSDYVDAISGLNEIKNGNIAVGDTLRLPER
ncbi:MAG: LysM peptidoglycan-binding domain-containing protein [Lachnospirales bacterium]